MKTLIFILLIGFSLDGFCQINPNNNTEIIYDFNTGINTELTQINVLPSSEYNNSIKFPGESSLTFSNIKNAKELRFQYQYGINAGTIDFKVQMKKSSETQYTDLRNISFSQNPVNNSTLYDLIINIPVNNEIDIRVATNYPDGSVGQFFIDNMKFIFYSSNELEDQKRKEEYLRESAKLASAQLTQVKVDDYNEKLELIKKEYTSNVDQLRTLSYRANTLASLSKLVVFVNKRNQLSNPSNYSIFNDKINFVKKNCDSIQINFINKLTEDIKPKEFKEPNIQNSLEQKSGFFKVVQVLGDVGNILTGGQFKSVVNSIQGVVSTIFDLSIIKNKIPELITTLSSNGKPIIKTNPNYSQAKVSTLIKEGIKVQKFFFDFFDILNKDREDFNQIVTEFEYYSRNTDILISSIDQTRNEFFKLVNSPMTDEYYLNTFLDVDNKKIADLELKVDNYFDGLIVAKTKKTNENIPSEHLRILEQADDMNKKIISVINDYKNHAADLRTLFSNVEQDLNKQNPFGKYSNGILVDERTDLFGDSFEAYDKLNTDAKINFGNLQTNLDKILR
jgi:hypothetical protein